MAAEPGALLGQSERGTPDLDATCNRCREDGHGTYLTTVSCRNCDVEFVPPERITVLICPRCGSITHRAKGERGRLCGCKLRTTRCIEAHYTLALYEQNGGTDGG